MTSCLLSIVVCTYHRTELLERCLSSLVKQSADGRFFEVVVVDNGGSANTAELVSDFSNRFFAIRYCVERTTGLSHARNRGIIEAAGTFVAYIDDDAVAYPDWVEQLFAFIERKPTVLAFGGPYEAMTDSPVPSWFPPEYGRFELGDTEISLNAQTEFLCGTNMVFKRELLLEVGGFNSDLGMTGNNVSYGEETRLQIEIKRKGYEIYYIPSLRVKHLIAREKMSFKWLMKSVYAVGKCSSKTFGVERTLFSCLGGLCFGCFYAVRFLAFKQGLPFKRKLYYSLIPLVSEFGVLTRLFGESHSER